ncbi:unnamed protein product (macronuclear) [Paramecium tetraurelia]|uniref:U2A'/phosphoprotein 32 family A C-terminal domain-containing protein n=1 Tax=Paramecium tetraurelia TaxID=5888 RepID=A0DGJ0_PARTE|nr:uncharacterized protein GSPATT00002286001 [Paramecium tetraurelia]CAK82157.1 unnamed protein product [Paramecium tetraurelia]|eukprot:XP_001449554.1 hypothetical protein (macronuclear) [Paramecium tetraurelia strain d4-2]
MKQIQKRKNNAKQQEKKKFDSSQLIKLMTAQKQKQQKGSKDVENLIGMSFYKIPIQKFSPEINQYLQKYKKESKNMHNFKATVSFIQCNLSSLEGLKFDGKQVKHLRADYNSLKGDSLQFIAQNFPNLLTLNLKHNQIANLEDLVHLQRLKNLEYLNLSFNPVKQFQDYKSTIFQYLPELQNLDNDADVDDSMQDTSEDLMLYSSEEESESSFDDYEESSDEDQKKKNKRKKVKK